MPGVFPVELADFQDKSGNFLENREIYFGKILILNLVGESKVMLDKLPLASASG
jgi:hypothetical protein